MSTVPLPDLTGRTILVTGGTSGVGRATAAAFAGAGAHVLITARNAGKARAVLDDLRREVPGSDISVLDLDLADLRSVEACAGRITADEQRLDVLVANAGVAGVPFARTAQGVELQFGVNHLGHHALVGRLLPLLATTPGARVVIVASGAGNGRALDLTDVRTDAGYRRYPAYARSKAANLVFVAEFHRRLSSAGTDVRAVACQPGYTRTSLGPRDQAGRIERVMIAAGNAVLAHDAETGAAPSLAASTWPDAISGSYVVPRLPGALHGRPAVRALPAWATDPALGRRLWDLSVELSGVDPTPTTIRPRTARPAP